MARHHVLPTYKSIEDIKMDIIPGNQVDLHVWKGIT